MEGERESRREGREGRKEVWRVSITKGGREGVIGGRERERRGERERGAE